MAGVLHDWWLDRIWYEIEYDFEPQKNSDGSQIYSKSKSGNNYSEYGKITTKTWKYVSATAVTTSAVPPSIDDIAFRVETDGSIDSNKLVLARPQQTPISLSPIGGTLWEPELPETSLDDYLFGSYSHSIVFKCAQIVTTYGTQSELKSPKFPPETTEE